MRCHRGRSLGSGSSFRTLFIYARSKLDGIVYSQADENGKCCHGYEGELDLQISHGSKGPGDAEQDYRKGEDGKLALPEEYEQGDGHEDDGHYQELGHVRGHL